MSLTYGGLAIVTPAGGVYTLPVVGVPWSPKLVKVNRAQPRGECGELRRSAFVGYRYK